MHKLKLSPARYEYYYGAQDVIAGEEKYDGLYVMRSNVSKADMSISEVVEAHKFLMKVE